MPLNGHTSLATWMYAIHHTLEHEGHDPVPVFAALDIDLDTIQGMHARVPKAQVNRLWNAVRSLTGDDAFSLKVIDHLNDPSINALVTTVQASQSVRDALQLLLRYYKLISSAIKITVELDREIRIIVSEAEEEPLLMPEDVDLVFGLIMRHGSFLPANEVKPSCVSLTRPHPQRWREFESFFQCPVEFAASQNQLCFPVAVLNASIPGANPILSNHLEHYFAEQSHRVADQDLEQRLRAALLSELPSGTPKLDCLARKLNMSKRTLQRKLQAENLSYTRILDELRLELARRYLGEKRYSVQEVADRLGYSEASNFVRFFRQHEGLTPSDYYQRARSGPGYEDMTKDGAQG